MQLYCWTLTFLSWLLHGSPPVEGHDYVSVDVDENGRGTLECLRCLHRSTSW